MHTTIRFMRIWDTWSYWEMIMGYVMSWFHIQSFVDQYNQGERQSFFCPIWLEQSFTTLIFHTPWIFHLLQSQFGWESFTLNLNTIKSLKDIPARLSMISLYLTCFSFPNLRNSTLMKSTPRLKQILCLDWFRKHLLTWTSIASRHWNQGPL